MTQASSNPSSSVFSLGNAPAYRHAPPFLCTLTADGSDAAWIRTSGELDLLTSPQLGGVLREAQLHARFVILDAREITFIDSSGVHVIFDASRVSASGGTRLLLLGSPAVELMLKAAGVYEQLSTSGVVSVKPADAPRGLPAPLA
jgi:anti-anti-sigma factor